MSENNYNKGKYRKCCTQKCSATGRILTLEHKEKTSKTLISLSKCNVYFNNCKKCNNLFTTKKKKNTFCSRKCISKHYYKKPNGLNKKINQTKREFNKIQNLENNKITYIYALLDQYKHIRYVGKSDNVSDRLNVHIKEAHLKRTHKEKWINSMLEQNLAPELLILEECVYSLWQFWETHYISLAKSWGFKLTNGTSGGEGSDGFKGRKHSEKTRNLIKQQLKKLPQNYNSKLIPSDILEIKNKFLLGLNNEIISKEYNVSIRVINNIRKGYNWKHIQ